MSPSLARRALVHASWLVRDRFADRPVTRVVQGVEMRLPWSHRLPDYALLHPTYGQNVVALARELAGEEPLRVIDVGANVGDTALQVLAAVDARVLCVEGDPHWLAWLRGNVDGDERVEVHAGLLAVDGSAASPVRSTAGTTRFQASAQATGEAPVTPARLLAEHPDFATARLVKSDTDGYDVRLVPALAEVLTSRPVLFFEYYPELTRLAGLDPAAVWPELESLGWTHAGVWDNNGLPLGRVPVAELAVRAELLEEGRPRWPYWDVALVHADDPEGAEALSALLPEGWLA